MRAAAIYVVYLAVFGGLLSLLRLEARRPAVRAFGWKLGLASVVVLTVAMFTLSEPHRPFEDFVEAYYAGGASVLQGRTGAEELFSRGVHGFVNLPILAFVFVPLALLSPGSASIVFTVAGVAACVLAWWQLVRLARLDERSALVLALLFALNGPLVNSLREGNTSHFALAAVTSALIAVREHRELRAGMLLGTAALFKLPLLLFGIYFLLRGRLRVVSGGGLVVVGAGVISVSMFGLDAHLAWHERFVAHAADHPVSAFNVQSVPALVARWVREGGGLYDWDGYPVGAALRRASAVPTAAFFTTALSAAVLSKGRPARWSSMSEAERDAEHSLVLVLACIASPLAWSHYYAWMLVPAAFVIAANSTMSGSCRRGLFRSYSAPHSLGDRAAGARSTQLETSGGDREGFASSVTARSVAWGAILAVSLPVVWPPAAPGGLFGGLFDRMYVMLVSHYFFGGVAMFLLLCLWRWRLGRLVPQIDGASEETPRTTTG